MRRGRAPSASATTRKRRSISRQGSLLKAATSRPVALMSVGKRLPTSTCSRNGSCERESASTTMCSRPPISTPIAVTPHCADRRSSTGCTSVGKAVALDHAAREREHPHPQAVALAGVDLHQFLVDQHAKDVQAGTGHHPERLRDGLHPERFAGCGPAGEGWRSSGSPPGPAAHDAVSVPGVSGVGRLFVRWQMAFVLGQYIRSI